MPILRRTGRLGMSEEARQQRIHSIGGSDARIIMSGDQDAIEHLWRQKRGEKPLDDLTDMLLVQMGIVMEPLVLDWFEFKTGLYVDYEQHRVAHPDMTHLTATLDGVVRAAEGQPELGTFEAKFMHPFFWKLDEAVAKYQPQKQHQLFCTRHDRGWLAIVTGAAVFAQVEIEADPLYQACQLAVLEDFWTCVRTGKVPGNPVIAPPPVEAVKVISMAGNNAWADNAATMLETTDACDRFEAAKKAIKAMMPADAKEARGHGVTIKRASNGRMTVVLEDEALEEARERQKLLKAVA